MKFFTYERVVRRYESDSTGLVNSSNYFRYMEESECAFFRSLGLSFFKKGSDVVFPRVSTKCQMLFPIKSGDKISINVSVKNLGKNSITLQFLFFNLIGDNSNILVAKGEFSIVSCVYNDGYGKLTPVPIELQMRQKVIPYVQ